MRQLHVPASGSARSALEARLVALEAEREALIRQKRRNILVGGAAISLLVHLLIMLYLDTIVRGGPPGDEHGSAFVEVSLLREEDLTELETPELEVDSPQASLELAEPDADPALEQDVNPPAADLDVTGEGALPTLGGGSQTGGDGLSLGGGGASTSFFGLGGEGSRFVYIVDVSGSMADQMKIRTALREVQRSIEGLPDYAYFFVILYETNIAFPPGQDGWIRARPHEVNRLSSWLETITPRGGTQPAPAFDAAFALNPRPDVIFFLTDGQIPEDTPTRVAAKNTRGSRVEINCIAFGEERGQDALRRIADESGGQFRLVPVGGGG